MRPFDAREQTFWFLSANSRIHIVAVAGERQSATRPPRRNASGVADLVPPSTTLQFVDDGPRPLIPRRVELRTEAARLHRGWHSLWMAAGVLPWTARCSALVLLALAGTSPAAVPARRISDRTFECTTSGGTRQVEKLLAAFSAANESQIRGLLRRPTPRRDGLELSPTFQAFAKGNAAKSASSLAVHSSSDLRAFSRAVAGHRFELRSCARGRREQPANRTRRLDRTGRRS